MGSWGGGIAQLLDAARASAVGLSKSFSFVLGGGTKLLLSIACRPVAIASLGKISKSADLLKMNSPDHFARADPSLQMQVYQTLLDSEFWHIPGDTFPSSSNTLKRDGHLE